MRNEKLPVQKYQLGEIIQIDSMDYTVTSAEFCGRDGKINIWYRVMGPAISNYYYEHDLDRLTGRK